MYIYICTIHTHIIIYIYVYIMICRYVTCVYIYIICMYICICHVYIYIYIYIYKFNYVLNVAVRPTWVIVLWLRCQEYKSPLRCTTVAEVCLETNAIEERHLRSSQGIQISR